jgi:hypothetical protein
MGINKIQFAVIVAAALAGLAKAEAETINITSQFSPIENLSAQDRKSLQDGVSKQFPNQKFDWEKDMLGLNQDGKIEVRDKATLQLKAVGEPSCYGNGIN